MCDSSVRRRCVPSMLPLHGSTRVWTGGDSSNSSNSGAPSSSPPCKRCSLHLPVQEAQLVHKDKHRDGVAAAAAVVGQEARPERERAARAGDRADGLHRAGEGQLARGGVWGLEGHPVLGRLERHRDDRVDEAGAHRRGELVGEAGESERAVQLLELVVGRDLCAPDQHRAHHKRLRAAVECGGALLRGDARAGVEDGLIVAPRRLGLRRVVRHADQTDLDGARDEGGAAAGDRGGGEALRKVRLAVLCERVAEGLEEAVPRCRVEDLPEATGAEAGVQAGDALALDQVGGERGKGSGRRAAARHDGQVHPDGQRVERVNTDPAQHAAEAGRAKDDGLAQRRGRLNGVSPPKLHGRHDGQRGAAVASRAEGSAALD
mmetsp:Transcript_2071/g.7378  ORF Transcript_2071/g.7378 Transcript_2071/m.7378 type:complete len:376 (-) Transcript_2071:8-1135(-)